MNTPPPPDCTLITACYDLNKYSSKCRTTKECLALINPLLQIPVYLVIYGSKTTIPAIQMQRQIYNLEKYTKYVQIELEDLGPTSSSKKSKRIAQPIGPRETSARAPNPTSSVATNSISSKKLLQLTRSTLHILAG